MRRRKLQLLDPDLAANEVGIQDITPHPFIMDTWFVTPLVNDLTQAACVRGRTDLDSDGDYEWEYDWSNVYSACAEPLPFILQRKPPGASGWATDDLPIGGLPSLRGLDMSTWSTLHLTGWNLEQLVYTTQGSGAFRGVIGW